MKTFTTGKQAVFFNKLFSKRVMKNGFTARLLIMVFLCMGVGESWGQTTVFIDDFSANQNAVYTTSGAINAGVWSVLSGGTAGQDFGARRNVTPAQLELTNDATAATNQAGWTFTSTSTSSFSSPYNPILNSNPGQVSWTFNMRQIRTDPAGLGAGSYGVAFVLAGSSTTTQTAGTGYAVALGQSGATDPIRLIKYSAGLATSTNIITSNTAGLTDFGAEYLSIQVLYTPSTNTWELLLRNDGATAFADPAAGTLTSQGTSVDATYTGSTLSLMGGYWSGSTGAAQTAFFDNTKVTVTSAGTPSINISTPGIGATTEFQGATNVVLQRYDLAVTSAPATLNGLTVTTAGTYAAADITNLKVRYSADAVLDGADATLSTKSTGLGAGSQLFPSFTAQSILSGNTGYIFVTADIAATATAGNTINIDPTAFSNISFAGTVNKTGTDPVAAAGTKTFAVLLPDIAISAASPAAGNINQNSTNNILYTLQLDVTTNNATLNSASFTTAGTYQVADLQANSFKLWINSTNSLSGATQLGTGQAVVATGNSISFTGLSSVISTGTTRYLLVTADVAYNATAANTVSITSTPFSSIVFASGNKTGTDPVSAGNAQTITAVTPSVAIAGATISAGAIGQNTVNNILYQMSFAVTANSTNFTGVTVTTGGTYVPADIQANGFKLWYNTVNSFSTATNIASLPVVASGGNLVFTGFSQFIGISTSGFIWITSDIASGAIVGNTINITSTAFSNILFDNGAVKTGTDPVAAGGLKTFVILPAAGEVLINHINPGYSTASTEYIELVNTTAKTFDLSTLKINYYSSGGVVNTSTVGTLSGSLQPHSFWLLSTNASVTVGLTTALSADATFPGGMAANNGQLSLQRVSDNLQIDGVAYGTVSPNVIGEGSAAPAGTTAPSVGISRVVDGVDNNTNSTDFATVTNANIYLRNSSSRLANAGTTIAAGTYTDIFVTGNSSIGGNTTLNNKLTLTSGAFTIGANTLTVNGTVSGAGTITSTSASNLVLGGTGSALNFTGGSALNNLTLNNASSATLNSALEVYGTIALTTANLNLNAQNLTLKSNASGTARIANLTGSTLSGATNVTMERYIKLRAGGDGRAYRLLGPTVNTTGSINANWMEGGMNTAIGTNVDPVPGYGTQISGSGGNANGFDKTASNAASLYTVTNAVTPTYTAVGSVNSGTMNAKTGYFLYLRGDRNQDMTLPLAPNMPTSATTLRTTGTLLTGTQTSFTNAFTGGGAWNLVTNPYPSPIDWSLVQPACTGVTGSYIYWDANIGTRGGFAAVTTAGVSTPATSATQIIQPGQAFFVESDGAVPTVSIQEGHKVAGNNNDVFFTAPQMPESFRTELYFTEPNGYRRIADGVIALYDNNYSATVDAKDTKEIGNWDENIAISRDGKRLAIESRPEIGKADDLPLYMNNMKKQSYEFEFTPSAFTNTSLKAELVDNFLGTRSLLSVTSPTVVRFTITDNPASAATDRFKIVFGAFGNPAGVDAITVKASQQGSTVQVNWTSKTETDMVRYEVERQTYGTGFVKVNSTTAKGNSLVAVDYNWPDTDPVMGTSFYRIKGTDKAGNVRYSEAVRVMYGKGEPSIVVYPNPVEGRSFKVDMYNLEKGTYLLSLYNNMGQLVYSQQLQHDGSQATRTITTDTEMSKGAYQLQLNGGNGYKTAQRVIFK